MAGTYASDGRWADESPPEDTKASAPLSAAASMGGTQTKRTSAQTGPSTGDGRGSLTPVHSGTTFLMHRY